MKINNIVIHNFRSFRHPAKLLRFVDPSLGQVRHLTVIVGSNGAGKSTVFDVVRTLSEYILRPQKKYPLLQEIERGDGYIGMDLELYQEDLGDEFFFERPADEPFLTLRVGYGNRDEAPKKLDEEWPYFYGRLFSRGKSGNAVERTEKGKTGNFKGVQIAEALRKNIDKMRDNYVQEEVQPYGGILYFPSNRQLPRNNEGGAIKFPSREYDWVFDYDSSTKWKGSLEELWVGQDYLDLKDQVRNRETQPQNLKKFIELTANILGKGRAILVDDKKGRVMVNPSWTNDMQYAVNLDQLPSGEQQVVLLFGEITRRQRPGSVLLIDEVENSLHPTLQRQVMWNLDHLAHSQNIQVIVSTHSITVLESIRPNAMENLDVSEQKFDQPVHAETGGVLS